MNMWAKQKNNKDRTDQQGFTIVELLIVIVVIGILAAITIVAYNGIQDRARKTAIISDVTNAGKQLGLDKAKDDVYPATAALAADGAGLKAAAGTTLQYTVDATRAFYCLNATKGTTTANISTSTVFAQPGSCTVGNRVANSSIEADTSDWRTASTTSLARVNTQASNGDYSLQINSTGAGGDRYVYAVIPTPPGSWDVKADVFLEGNAAPDFGRGMWINNIQGTTSGQVSYVMTTLNSWQTMSYTYVEPAGSTGIWVRFYVTPGFNIYVDNLRVTPT